ncbi:hypothetical protein L3073_04830 [Ancylomarina sp. DW003]|nr:hypothetical protein [Ancylomarina sp. DW003]MDE5421521.1 hypothetical protein [Ancylomarina sp. DW003]
MIQFEKQINNNVLDIPELKELRNQDWKFRTKKTYYHKKKLLEKLNSFFDWYVSYCKSNLKGKTYSQKNISQLVLKLSFKNQQHWNEYLTKSLFLSLEYVKYLKNVVTIKNIGAFDHTLSSLEIDLEWLIASYEVDVKKTVKSISLNSGRRKNLSPTDLFSAVRTLFRIEEFSKMEELYLRDLKPVVMFQIRQLLEVYGRELIGYYAINDKNGLPVKKFTQVSWEFIKEEVKSKKSRIKFPFDVQMIIDINRWTNNFVHTTYLHSSYIQYFVLKAIGVLFASKSKGIKIYTGKISNRFDIADIEITNYNSLKTDFEQYLNNKIPNTFVEWMPTNKVGAYIISE